MLTVSPPGACAREGPAAASGASRAARIASQPRATEGSFLRLRVIFMDFPIMLWAGAPEPNWRPPVSLRDNGRGGNSLRGESRALLLRRNGSDTKFILSPHRDCLIIYGLVTETSIYALFRAAFIPATSSTRTEEHTSELQSLMRT